MKMYALALALVSIFPTACKSHGESAATESASSGTQAQAVPAVAPDEPAAPASNPPPNWPREFQQGGDTIVMYQPQVDSWKDQSTIEFRSALAVTPEAGGQSHYGVATVKGDTVVDENDRNVLVSNMVTTTSFPGLTAAQSQPLDALVKSLLTNAGFVDIALDQVLAYVHDDVKTKRVALNLDPPPMFYSDVPAILVSYMGAPQFEPVSGPQLMFAVNTNWVVLFDTASSKYFLLDGDSWLTAPDPVKGPWTQASALPATVSSLPSTGNWASVKSHVPGTPFKVVPKVFASTKPAELIVTQGPPDYTPLAGTRLMYVSNPVMPLFLDLLDYNYYFLTAGRWFRAPKPSGPWTAASTDLPAEFAKIPPTSPVGFVLASVPHTQEAEDAILLASVPHKATIDIATATVNVTYSGAPQFVPIQGTSMTYAVNTPNQVLLADGQYYCCYQGVWFLSPIATGPWVVCTSVPAVIYTMPPSCPLYNCTYVQVYSYTPSTVVVGYTAGYSGEYVAATGALMFGAGMLVGAAIADDDHWYGYPPCYYSYGTCCHYSYGYGCYTRTGGSYYGPNGGCGWGAAYNPATGTYARGGAAYGPDGGHWGAQAYNPWTNTYAQHTGGSSGYKSWGNTYVQQGSKWAEAGHQSGAYGSVGWAENSKGQSAVGVSNKSGTAVAKTSTGDTYAAHDGNVYKNNGDGSWQKYDGNGNWSNTSASKPASSTPSSSGANSWSDHSTQQSLNQDSWARNQGNANAASSYNDRSNGWSGASSGGGWGGGGGGGAGGFGGGGGGDRFGGGGGGWGGRGGGRR